MSDEQDVGVNGVGVSSRQLFFSSSSKLRKWWKERRSISFLSPSASSLLQLWEERLWGNWEKGLERRGRLIRWQTRGLARSGLGVKTGNKNWFIWDKKHWLFLQKLDIKMFIISENSMRSSVFMTFSNTCSFLDASALPRRYPCKYE